MAVTVTSGGTFPTSQNGQQPGLYVRFVQKALTTIGVGSRSKVATIKSVYTGTAVSKSVYRITNLDQATTLFGASNVNDITDYFTGGASEVVVATVDPLADTTAYTAALNLIQTYEFHVFSLPSTADSNLETTVYSWLKSARNDGKNFITVFFAGSDKEGKVTDIVAKANSLADESVVFVGNGVKNADGTQKPAPEYAQYIAGLVAGTPLDGSLTYVDVPYAETIYRFVPSDIKTLLAAGVLVTVTDGDTPRIEQGLTLGDQGTPFFKIRTVRAKQAMIDDIDSAVKDNYIGRITNNYDGQLAVINAIKVYLETLANANVIDQTYNVAIDKTIASVGAEMYVNIAVKYLDSIEFVYLTISV